MNETILLFMNNQSYIIIDMCWLLRIDSWPGIAGRCQLVNFLTLVDDSICNVVQMSASTDHEMILIVFESRKIRINNKIILQRESRTLIACIHGQYNTNTMNWLTYTIHI